MQPVVKLFFFLRFGTEWSSGFQYGTDIRTLPLQTGMTQNQVINLAGNPTHINYSVVNGAHHDQWVYKWGTVRVLGGDSKYYAYLYFDDGILTAWQY